MGAEVDPGPDDRPAAAAGWLESGRRRPGEGRGPLPAPPAFEEELADAVHRAADILASVERAGAEVLGRVRLEAQTARASMSALEAELGRHRADVAKLLEQVVMLREALSRTPGQAFRSETPAGPDPARDLDPAPNDDLAHVVASLVREFQQLRVASPGRPQPATVADSQLVLDDAFAQRKAIIERADRLLDEAIRAHAVAMDEVERSGRIAELEQRAAVLNGACDEAEGRRDRAVAQADSLRADARTEADRMIEAARIEAEEIVSSAHDTATQIVARAHQEVERHASAAKDEAATMLATTRAEVDRLLDELRSVGSRVRADDSLPLAHAPEGRSSGIDLTGTGTEPPPPTVAEFLPDQLGILEPPFRWSDGPGSSGIAPSSSTVDESGDQLSDGASDDPTRRAKRFFRRQD